MSIQKYKIKFSGTGIATFNVNSKGEPEEMVEFEELEDAEDIEFIYKIG
jgi:hypothetical protein